MVPVVALLDIAVLLLGPAAVVIALLVSAVARSTRPVRSVVLVAAYAGVELSLLPRVLRADRDWDALLREVLARSYPILRSVLDVTVELEPGSATPEQVATGHPLIVLSRHCGPGDSLFVAWLLSGHYRLRLGAVLKSALRLEPVVDLAGDHLPLCFVNRDRAGTRQRITGLAATLASGDALLLFPEGGNFTWPRRRKAIRSLIAHGAYRRARQARRSTHTLPPHTGGSAAALTGAPTADVLVLTHSGFAADGRNRPWWRLPVHTTLLVRTTLVPSVAVPRDEDALTDWLVDAWSTVDTWIAGHSTG
ncbi:MAG TPA: 1-acyl-sn-glycerol-3-phosphate acyltransferase [Pseudonocardiaceae bacterium]|nr:1-acyl-sn-glycerol-3-phosphate acyltransferase [Pseudonocardiaceae bacterium]